jgi:translation initiation factor IF-2
MTGAKMRVYEIAKEVGIPNKDLITKIRALGLEVNNHMSSLDPDDVARIKRSLEKEKQAVVQPQQTQKLSTGTVLRRRSSGEKSADSNVDDHPHPVREPARPAPSERPLERPAHVNPPPMVRRRVADDTAAAAIATATATPPAVPAPILRSAPPEIVRPPVRPEPAVIQPVVVAPEPAHVPAPHPAPAVPTPIAATTSGQVASGSNRNHENGHSTEAAHAAPAKPAISHPEAEAQAAAAVSHGKPAKSEPVASMAAEPSVATERPRSRVILTGPQVVARGTDQAAPSNTRAPERVPPRVEPPPSTPLPPRVTTPAPHTTSTRKVEVVVESARGRFERELERARARTTERPKSDTQPPPELEVPPQDVEQAPIVARDPSRPAVGSVIALPPRIKITERTPVTGRPPPGAAPVNPIRGRFAQQQQRGGPRGPGGRPGPHNDFGRKKLPLGKKGKQTILTTPAEHKRVIRIEDTISVGDLSRNMGIKSPEVLKKLWGMGMTGVTINASIDFDTAVILASEFGYEVQNVAFKEEDIFSQKTDEENTLTLRSPVVTVMGHVDHGKTTLLDAIRKTRVAAGESGGITQHVAAYKVASPSHGDIVFLDTPGHEAFTEMRARGAQATDIVVLVVAANDGVMPQTVEALSHAKDAGVVIIVAVNKIDMPDAAPDRVRQQLADHGLIPEEWGGDTIYVNVSALRGEGIDKLLESIAVAAEMQQLTANPDKPASGVVIEARLDRNRGPMATVLIQEGTLRVGDMVVAGRTFGKVRAMLDDRGEPLEEAGPSTPIELLGLDGVPEAGDQVNGAEDDKVAKQVVEHRRQQFRKRELASTARVSLESLMKQISDTSTKELKIVLKADVQGSAEALKTALVKQSTEKVKVTVIAAAVGGITESDVNLAKAGNAIIVGFHVRPAGKSSKLAEQEGVEIRLYDIIYDALDEVKAAMAGLLAPIKREVPIGKLSVRETFSIPKMGMVAGCMVTDGKVNRKAHLRIIRDSVQIYEGKVGSLRRFKDDVSEVTNGFECGVMVAGYNELKAGDEIEAYEVIEEAAQL